MKSEWKTSSNKTPKRWKQRKKPQIKENKNYIAHKMYSIWFAMMSVIFAPAAGWLNWCCPLYQSQLSQKTWLKSALGLGSRNAIRSHLIKWESMLFVTNHIPCCCGLSNSLNYNSLSDFYSCRVWCTVKILEDFTKGNSRKSQINPCKQ